MGSPVTARGSGQGAFCSACRAVYCSVHTIWVPEELPAGAELDLSDPRPFIAHCPECDGVMGGAERE